MSATADSRPAVAAFSILALLKVTMLGRGLRLLSGGPLVGAPAAAAFLERYRTMAALGILVIYGAQLVLCIALCVAILRKSAWARGVGILYGGGHLLGILAIATFPGMSLLNFIAGCLALYGLKQPLVVPMDPSRRLARMQRSGKVKD